jgi:alkyl sulfatase BDS1-like metallo-beta-lactamase superfamily hydrolase
LVRDAKAWADYLTESIRLYADRSDVMFAAHGIPRFGQAEIAAFLTSHRDAYKYLHDQSVRLMNGGFTAAEIAEVLKLPDVLSKQWFNRGYYGTMSHNSKAVYQRYMGWYDANPANLNPHPPEEAARRYVAAMGGAANVLGLAERAIADGDLRWAATLLNHVVFAGGETQTARDMLARVYRGLGFESEAGTWRNIYLTGAQELENGVMRLPPAGMNVDVLSATTTSMLLDFAAVRVDPAKALRGFTVRLELTDRKESHLITVGNGVLVHEEGVGGVRADAVVALKRPVLLATLLAGADPAPLVAAGEIAIAGEASLYDVLTGLIDPVVANFPIVTP